MHVLTADGDPAQPEFGGAVASTADSTIPSGSAESAVQNGTQGFHQQAESAHPADQQAQVQQHQEPLEGVARGQGTVQQPSPPLGTHEHQTYQQQPHQQHPHLQQSYGDGQVQSSAPNPTTGYGMPNQQTQGMPSQQMSATGMQQDTSQKQDRQAVTEDTRYRIFLARWKQGIFRVTHL